MAFAGVAATTSKRSKEGGGGDAGDGGYSDAPPCSTSSSVYQYHNGATTRPAFTASVSRGLSGLLDLDIDALQGAVENEYKQTAAQDKPPAVSKGVAAATNPSLPCCSHPRPSPPSRVGFDCPLLPFLQSTLDVKLYRPTLYTCWAVCLVVFMDISMVNPTMQPYVSLVSLTPRHIILYNPLRSHSHTFPFAVPFRTVATRTTMAGWRTPFSQHKSSPRCCLQCGRSSERPRRPSWSLYPSSH